MEEKMTTNSALQTNAFGASEAARTAIATVFDDHVFYRGWPSNYGGNLEANLFPVPSSLTFRDSDNDGVKDNLYDDKVSAGYATDIYDTSTVDVTYNVSVTGTGMKADIYIFRNLARNAAGSSAAMVSGYEGTGKASAGSGGNVWFDLRAVSTDVGGAQSTTNSDYRFVVRK
jgi:hypothetical protein